MQESIAMENGQVVNPDITPEQWLAGYFGIVDDPDTRGATNIKKGIFKSIDYLRLKDVSLHLLDPKPGKTILDLGCANGATMVYCGLQGATVFGQDLDAAAVKAANEMCQRFHIKAQASVGNVMSLDFPDNEFDAVISCDFMEHITEEEKVKTLREARRVLKPGGVLITKTPNLAYLQLALAYKRVRALARGKNPFDYVIPHTPGVEDPPQHIGLTTRWGFTRALHEAGFLNWDFHYGPLRRFGRSYLMDVLSTEIPVVRDLIAEDVLCRAFKPIALSHFPD